MANRDYKKQHDGDFPDLPRSQVWLKTISNDNTEYRDLFKQLSQGCYRLLLQNSGKLYLFKPLGSNTPYNVPVIQITEDDVAMLRIFPENTSCKN